MGHFVFFSAFWPYLVVVPFPERPKPDEHKELTFWMLGSGGREREIHSFSSVTVEMEAIYNFEED